MVVTDISKGATLDISVGDRVSGHVKRSPGIHLSDVLRHLGLKMKLIPEDEPIEEADYYIPAGVRSMDLAAYNRITIGLAFEMWMALAYPHIYDHLGECELDGILMTPDGLEYLDATEDIVVHEYKCTWKTSRHPIEKHVLWLMQIKAYCKVMKTLFAKIHIMYVNGNYKYDATGGPCFRVLALSFTQKEIDANWAMIVNYKNKHKSAILKGIAA